MKKVFILCVLFLFTICFYSKEKIEYAFKESVQGYYRYEIQFENKEVSTLNFEEYFKNYKILTIYPSISEVYRNRFPFTDYTFNSYQTFSQNLNKFLEKYVATLENLGYRKEALKARTGGIFIEKVIIYSDEEAIINIKHNFPKLKYRLLDSI